MMEVYCVHVVVKPSVVKPLLWKPFPLESSIKTSYLNIVEPPLSAGAVHDISILAPFAKILIGALGAQGAIADLRLAGLDGSLSPISL